jgi:uncharacterized repeat protein (TIGR01451 family)/gliding motility-associated-like protein
MSGVAQNDVVLSFTTTDGVAIVARDYIAKRAASTASTMRSTVLGSDNSAKRVPSSTEGIAVSGSDYIGQTAVSYTIPAGSTSVAIPVTILGDLISEPTEAFTGAIEISNANGQPVNITTAEATATIYDDDIADLSITKVGNPAVVVAGQNITYTITVHNIGTNQAQNVVVSDVLPSGLSIVSASTETGSWTSPKWTIGSLLLGKTATLTIVATVNPTLANASVLNNTASVASATTDPDKTNNTASSSNTVTTQSDLAITLSIEPRLKAIVPNPNVVMGEDLTYYVDVYNHGPSDAFGVAVTHTPSGLSSVKYSSDNGTSWQSWTGSYTVGSLVNGSSASFLLKGIVAIDHCTVLANSVTVSSPGLNDPNMMNNTATSSVQPVDKTAPEITCSAHFDYPVDAGVCGATLVIAHPAAVDNCSTILSYTGIRSDALALNAVYPVGSTVITWTATDQAGNVSKVCPQVITVVDDERPVIICPGTVKIVANASSYSASEVELGSPVTRDNCSVVSVTNDTPTFYSLGTNYVVWTVTDASGNTATCTQTVMAPERLFIPSGFSPDGDGVNDYFEITGIGNYPKSHLWVYNRWGNLMYDKHPYDNTWDGKLNVNGLIFGDELPEGTYFYILDLGDNSSQYQGYVVIKR